jgi:hypothetical protein
MTTETEENTLSPQRYLELAGIAEECAKRWRQRAEELGATTTEEPAPVVAPVAPKPTGRPKGTNVDKVVELCKRPNGATAQQLMVAAGWIRPPYPSTVAQLAVRRKLKFSTREVKPGEIRFHMTDL